MMPRSGIVPHWAYVCASRPSDIKTNVLDLARLHGMVNKKVRWLLCMQ